MSLSLCSAQELSVADFLQCCTPQSRNMEGLLFYTKTCNSILISYDPSLFPPPSPLCAALKSVFGLLRDILQR